jgi:hypothetical protein
MVSLIAVETGKVTAKTGKALVKNGTCQWSDALYESTSFSQPTNGKHGNKELYKLVVSMVNFFLYPTDFSRLSQSIPSYDGPIDFIFWLSQMSKVSSQIS